LRLQEQSITQIEAEGALAEQWAQLPEEQRQQQPPPMLGTLRPRVITPVLPRGLIAYTVLNVLPAIRVDTSWCLLAIECGFGF
jgi:hypothetical protein